MDRWHNFATHEEWGDVQTNEIITNCQNNVCTADVHNPDREKDTKRITSVSCQNVMYIRWRPYFYKHAQLMAAY